MHLAAIRKEPGPRSRSRDETTVLVVDDSKVLRKLLKEELEAEGFRVLSADNGESALDIARRRRPDLVLLDVVLPGIDGYEVCREMRGDPVLHAVPVLMLSGRNELKDKIAGFEAGVDDYLTKPFFTKELVARMRSQLRTKASLDDSRRLSELYLEMLFGIGSAISSPFQVDDDLAIILRQALLAAGARRGSILLHGGKDDEFEVRGIQGYPAGQGPRIGDRVRVSDRIPTAELDGEEPLSIRLFEEDDGRTLFVPMVAKEKLIGGFEFIVDAPGARLPADSQKLLFALSSQAAIFIENARLENDVRSMFLNIIVSMAGAVDAKDAYTHGHSLRVARMALLIGQEHGLPREELEPLLLAAMLHDVGKIAVPDEILKKPGRLDVEEFEIMKTHPSVGAKMLAHIPELERVIPGILHHHEYWNGNGYPEGIEGERIPLSGRIIHISDAFDAMTTDRIYRRKVSVEAAVEEILRFSGTQFDPGSVRLFEAAYRYGKIHEKLPDETPDIHDLIDQLR